MADKAPASFDPTANLLASALAAGPAIDKAKSVRPSYIPIHIDFQVVEKEYDAFCQQNQKLIPEAVGSPANVIHKYTILFQSGVFHLDSKTAMIAAVVLQKTGDLKSITRSTAGENSIEWGPVGTVHFLPGTSTLKSTGDGSVVCFVVFYGTGHTSDHGHRNT
ncbi:hypothetical protein HJFPF1_12217 [Paramyrothecium foliicola]|nr:hypothetical protein HJFPF1_12217 [Paramyrothecium foliicola]